MADSEFQKKFEAMFGPTGKAGPAGATLVINPGGQPASDDDAELLQFLKDSAPKILVIGTGGSGSNTITRMGEIGILGAKLVAMNTDAQHLVRTKAEKKVLLGRKRTRGLGAGSNPQVGEQAAVEAQEEIAKLVDGFDLVFVTCGMGGGTGTGSAHVIAKIAKAKSAIVVGVVTMPFSSEGAKRMHHAIEGLELLKKEADTTIVIPNDKLLLYAPDLPLNAAFRASDQVLSNAVKGIAELVTKSGLVNVDFADVRSILEKSGTAVIGLGEVDDAQDQNRAMTAAEKALNSPLLDFDVRNADKCLINITGGPGLTLGEAEAAVNAIASKISKNALLKWGAAIDDALGNKSVKVLVVLGGVTQGTGGSLMEIPARIEEAIGDVEFLDQ